MTALIKYLGIEIVQLEVPSTQFVWFHDETDGHGEADTVEEAQAQIDAHLGQVGEICSP